MADKTIHELTQIGSVTQATEFPIWDGANNTTKKATLQQVKELIASGIVAGVSFVGTRAGYETAKLIPAGQEGYIPDSSLVIITDENRTYVTSGTGAEQTLTLIARVMSAGDGINISNDDKINADTVTFTGTRAEWELLSSSQKAKYNIVNFTDEELTDDVITDTVEDGNMLAVTSNAVARILKNSAIIASTGVNKCLQIAFMLQGAETSKTLDLSSYFDVADFPASGILYMPTKGFSELYGQFNLFDSAARTIADTLTIQLTTDVTVSFSKATKSLVITNNTGYWIAGTVTIMACKTI